MQVAVKIVLSPEQFQQLTAYANSRSAPFRLVERSKLILAANQGRENRCLLDRCQPKGGLLDRCQSKGGLLDRCQSKSGLLKGVLTESTKILEKNSAERTGNHLL